MSGRAPVAVAVAIACCAGLAACGGSSGNPVRAKVRQFISAVQTRDYQTICRKVLAPSLLADLAQGGVDCEQALSVALAGVHSPRLTIGKVNVSGNAASALTVSSATGQSAVLTSIKLVKTPAGWRVNALGSPIG